MLEAYTPDGAIVAGTTLPPYPAATDEPALAAKPTLETPVVVNGRMLGKLSFFALRAATSHSSPPTRSFAA